MVTPSDPRLEFLLQVQADCREYGAIRPQRLQNPPVLRAVINEVWCGGDPVDVLSRFDKIDATARLRHLWADRVGVQVDALARTAAIEDWVILDRQGVQAHHRLYQVNEVAARLALRQRSPLAGMSLVTRYRVARAKATTELFSEYGRSLVARLPVGCNVYRALDSRVYAGGNGASEGLVHVFPKDSILLPNGRTHPAGEALGRKRRFWTLVDDDGTTPIALDDLKVVERIVNHRGRAI
jgi:hypothetical protein